MSRGLTRRQAIPKAIEILQCLPQTDEVAAVVQALEKYFSTPLARWDIPSVYEALSEWSEQHDGRGPSVKECDTNKNLPSHQVFERLFQKPAKEVLMNLYGEQDYVRIGKHKILCVNSEYDFLEIFKKEFERIQPSTSKTYDANRDQNTPTWQTIARRCKVSNWSELVTLSGVKANCLRRRFDSYRVEKTITAERKQPAEDTEEIEKNREEMLRFTEILEKADKIINQTDKGRNEELKNPNKRTIQVGRK